MSLTVAKPALNGVLLVSELWPLPSLLCIWMSTYTISSYLTDGVLFYTSGAPFY